MSSKVMQKPYVLRLKYDTYNLAIMYLCFFNKIPLDLMLALYEKFGKHALFYFIALARKGYIRVSSEQMQKILDSCSLLVSQIHRKQLNRLSFDSKMLRFLEEFLLVNTEDIFAEEVRFFFDLDDFYG